MEKLTTTIDEFTKRFSNLLRLKERRCSTKIAYAIDQNIKMYENYLN
jgi:hypothetical protein